MAYQISRIPMTFSELEGKLVVTSDKTHCAVPLYLHIFLYI